jgi:hypothetical protein
VDSSAIFPAGFGGELSLGLSCRGVPHPPYRSFCDRRRPTKSSYPTVGCTTRRRGQKPHPESCGHWATNPTAMAMTTTAMMMMERTAEDRLACGVSLFGPFQRTWMSRRPAESLHRNATRRSSSTKVAAPQLRNDTRSIGDARMARTSDSTTRKWDRPGAPSRQKGGAAADVALRARKGELFFALWPAGERRNRGRTGRGGRPRFYR